MVRDSLHDRTTEPPTVQYLYTTTPYTILFAYLSIYLKYLARNSSYSKTADETQPQNQINRAKSESREETIEFIYWTAVTVIGARSTKDNYYTLLLLVLLFMLL